MKFAKLLLVGPMGAGKTTLGTLLSEQLGWPYFDNDKEIAIAHRLSTQELSELSVSELHSIEQSYLASVMQRPAPFISGVAASVVDYVDCRKLLQDGTTIYLRLPLAKILERTGDTGIGRQALKEHASEIIKERFLRRDPLYREVASFTIDLGANPGSDALSIVAYLEAALAD
jgi:shikimate kinase